MLFNGGSLHCLFLDGGMVEIEVISIPSIFIAELSPHRSDYKILRYKFMIIFRGSNGQ